MRTIKSICLYALAILSISATAQSPVATLGDNKGYSSGSYMAYMSPWGTNGIANVPVWSEAFSVIKSSFPSGSSAVWNWPATPAPRGVWTFIAIDYGNYSNTVVPSPIPSKKVSAISRLVGTHSVSIAGETGNADVIYDFFTTTTAGNSSTQAHEIEIFLHSPGFARSYAKSVTPIGTYTDSNGVAWSVSIDRSRTTHDILIMPANYSDQMTGSVDILAMLNWLVALKWVSPNEYFNGLALGVEVRQGQGAAWINSFSVSYN